MSAPVRVRPYEFLAPFYDEVMKDFPYGEWLSYIEKLCDRCSLRVTSVLDVACGTGTFALMIARKGIRVVGVDRSEAMIRVAREKAAEAGLKIPFLVGDITGLALREKFDLVVCMYDSLNYLARRRQVARALESMAEVLRPGGLLIFDVNTAYGLDKFWGNRVTVQQVGGVKMTWDYSYSAIRKLAGLTIQFERGGAGTSTVYKEEHWERAYRLSDIKRLLARVGLEVAALTDDRKLEPPGRLCDRAWFAARCVCRGAIHGARGLDQSSPYKNA